MSKFSRSAQMTTPLKIQRDKLAGFVIDFPNIKGRLEFFKFYPPFCSLMQDSFEHISPPFPDDEEKKVFSYRQPLHKSKNHYQRKLSFS